MDEDKKPPAEKTVILQDETLKQFQGGFTAIPNRILQNGSLSLGARMTYAMLLKYAWQDNFCFPAQAQIAKDLGLKERMTRYHLEELKRHKLIDWKRQGLNRPNIYYILRLPDFPDRQSIADPDRQSTSAQDRQRIAYNEYSSTKTQKDVNVAFSSSRKNNHPTASEEVLLADIAAELGDKNPKSKAAFRKVINVLGSEATRQLLSLTKEAHQRGQIRGKKAPYFIGMAKNIAGERGLSLGFGSTLTKRAPLPHDTTASDEAIKQLPPDLQAAFASLKAKIGNSEAVQDAKGYHPQPTEV